MIYLLPAVDVTGGRACQVPSGQCDAPLDVAMRWVREGAQWLHLVDLDRAFRRGDSLDQLSQIIASVPVPVQLSGGLDDRDSIAQALATGAQRVNLASTALLDMELVRWAVGEHGSAVVVGLDLRGSMVVARGSGVEVGELDSVVAGLAATGAKQFLVADASRDGSRRGANVTMFGSVTSQIVAAMPDATVVASGGVASADDVSALAALESDGLQGIVLGAALHQGAFTFAEALEAASAGRAEASAR